MAQRKVETVFTAKGDAAYKSALSDINKGISVLNSEMKKATAQFSDNESSMEALSSKSDILERKLLSQKEAVDVLKKALADSAEAYGEGDKRTQDLQISLNNAEAQVYKTEAALKQNKETMEGSTTSSVNFGSVLDTLADKFGVNLPPEVQKGITSFTNFGTKGVAAVALVIGEVEALIEVEKKLMNMTTDSAASADEILTESVKTGMSTDEIQRLKYAAELVDVSYDTIASSVVKLTNNMDSARDGSSEMQEAFDTLGVSITNSDGTLRDANDVFYECIDALGNVGSGTEADALAMDIFGKSAEDLNPLIAAGSEKLAELGEEAENTGYIMSTDELEALGAVDDALQRMKNSQEAVRNNLSVQFAPTAEKVYTQWGDFITQVGDALAESGLVSGMGNLLTSVSGLLDPLGDLAETVLPKINVVLDPVAGLIAWIADTLEAIAGLAPWNWGSGMLSTALGYGDEQSNLQKWLYSDTHGYVSYNATGDTNFHGGMTWVGENGPEIVSLPGGSSIYNSQESRAAGGDTYNITIDAKNVQEFNDVVRIMKSARQTARMG